MKAKYKSYSKSYLLITSDLSVWNALLLWLLTYRADTQKDQSHFKRAHRTNLYHLLFEVHLLEICFFLFLCWFLSWEWDKKTMPTLKGFSRQIFFYQQLNKTSTISSVLLFIQMYIHFIHVFSFFKICIICFMLSFCRWIHYFVFVILSLVF